MNNKAIETNVHNTNDKTYLKLNRAKEANSKYQKLRQRIQKLIKDIDEK